MTRLAKNIFSAGLGGCILGLLGLPLAAAPPAVLPANLPLCFEALGGQTPGPAPFIARTHDGQFLISPAEAQIALRQSGGAAATVRMQFAGANPQAQVRGDTEMPGKINYLTGNNSAQWRVGVTLFARVRVEELYPGINLVYYGNQQQLEYDFTIAPGVNPDAIVIHFAGADKISVNRQGELIVSLAGGEIRQPRPVIYQTIDGARREIAGGYRLVDAHTAAFAVGKHDSTRPLVIDPVLNYSGYFGGTAGETAWAVAVDTNGYVYITGETFSQKFFTNGWTGGPAFSTYGAFQTSYHGGKYTGDAFVAKLDLSSGATTIKYLTYLGGSADDGALSLAVDAAGDVYVTGFTDSSDFPITTNALYKTINGTYNSSFGSYPIDAFVTELNPSGSNLIYSTYLGGSGMDCSVGIAVDSAGAAYLTGFTYSSNFPTVNALQKKLACTNSIYYNANAFIAKIGSGGSPLAYSTYFGGANFDQGQSIAVDTNGFVYVTGFTASTNFPTTNFVYQLINSNMVDGHFLNRSTKRTSAYDAFVLKFDPPGTNLVYSTLLGSTNDDMGRSIAVDNTGAAYVTGWSVSSNFPNTLGTTVPGLRSYVATNTSSSRPATNVFLTRITNGTQAGIAWSTLFGGRGADVGNGVAVDPAGEVFVTGSASSTNFPPFNVPVGLRLTNSGKSDAFVIGFNTNATALLYATYLGGRDNDYGYGIAVAANGDAYVVGQTLSTNFPVFGGGFTNRNGTNDMFLTKIILQPTRPVIIAQQGTNWAVSVGSALEMSVTATGTTSLTYQWQTNGVHLVNGGRISGATSASLIITNAQTTDSATNYTVIITNYGGAVTSSLYSVLVTNIPPSITVQPPTNRTVEAGSAVTLAVVAKGTAPLRYQWQTNGVNLANGGRINGATNATLTITNAQTTDSGNYTVIVTNFGGAVTSSVAVLTVTNSPPTILVEPASRAVEARSVVTLAVTASGTAPLRYQWQTNGIDLVTGGRIRGATNPTLTITNAQTTDSGYYTVIVTNFGGSVTSSVAALTVTNYPPAILVQPTNQTVATNQTVQFVVTAVGGVPLSYRWQTNGINLVNGTNISGVTSNILTLSAVRTNDSATNFTVIVSNYAGSVTSAAAALLVTAKPVITVQPTNQTVEPGQQVYLVVKAVGTAPLRYQWRMDGTNLVNGGQFSGATNKVLVINTVQLTNTGNYTVIVTNTAGSVTSSVAALTVTNYPPTIEVQPASQLAEGGTVVTLAVVATGTAPLSYQWQTNGIDLVNGGRISGATNASLIITNAQTTDSASYTVIVTNIAGVVTSSVAALTVTNYPPVIVAQPTNRTVDQGKTFNFLVTATGTAPLSYQWQTNGINLANGGRISGATSASLVITNAQLTDGAPNYTVIVTNIAGAVTSSVATLTVLSSPVIVVQPTNQEVAAGATATFEVTATGAATLSYQWLKNNTPLANYGEYSGVTTYKLTITDAQTYDNDTYKVVVTNAFGTVTSSNATLTVTNVPPTIVVQPTNQTVGVESTVQLVVEATGTEPLSYQWQLDGTNLVDGDQIDGATTDVLAISNAQTTNSGTYTVIVTNILGSVTSSNAVLKVTASPEILVQPTNSSFAVGDTATLVVTAVGLEPLSYQWWMDETNLVSGATTNVLIISNAQTTNSGSYSVVITNVAGSVTSSNAVLTITNVATVLDPQPTNQTVGVGSTVTFIVNGTAQPPFFLQWLKDGMELTNVTGHLSGATSATLVISNVQTNDSGTYWLVVSNAWGTLASSNAVLTVLSLPVFTTVGGGSSSSFILSGAGGTNNGTYYVLTSSNLLLPLGSWTPIATNQFDHNGNFIFTNTAPTNAPQEFYLLQLP